MDGFGIVLFLVGIGLYFYKKQPFWLFVAGTGFGILVGAIWAYFIVMAA